MVGAYIGDEISSAGMENNSAVLADSQEDHSVPIEELSDEVAETSTRERSDGHHVDFFRGEEARAKVR